MNYKITKQFPNQQEMDCARFANELDAKLALNALFANDFNHKTNVIYRLFDKYGDIIVQFDTNKDKPIVAAGAGAGAAASAASAGGSSQTSGFKPTPFSTTPTPPGGPKKWTTTPDDENKDEDGKK